MSSVTSIGASGQDDGLIMQLDDDRWKALEGGYRIPYDPRPALRRLDDPAKRDEAWGELWQELHHQGDVGLASYAALPELVRIGLVEQANDWNVYALAATIEECRAAARNPPLPDWLAAEYEQAWDQVFQAALKALPEAEDDNLVSSLFSVLALFKKRPFLGRFALLTGDEQQELLDEASSS